ncbi:flagellar hook protein FlgE [mine drainage metagenome]|uniref:Flagellar hook protein FlgE n=1 Tax=mine drainage metagenome TaxID=410659 RepID=A0A1J5RDC4_9ZZZZ
MQATYDNGLTKDLGTIAVCTFQDPNALIPVGDSQWQENKSTIGGSGQAQINSPGASGSGILQPSATEGSNVDLTAQLVDMITQQRNYQANAQTIKTMDSIMQTLINLR